MITRTGKDRYVLKSHKGKKLGSFRSKKAAKKRERQINYFKHRKK